MNTSHISDHPWRILGWVFGGFLALLILMEGWLYLTKPDFSNQENIIAKNLEEAVSLFQTRQQELLIQTRQLAFTLESQISQELPGVLYETLQDYDDLWGTALISEQEAIVWNGFSLGVLQSLDLQETTDFYVEVKKQNNVLFWLAHIAFTLEDEEESTTYHLYTLERISQTNALQIGANQEYTILNDANRRYTYPLAISIYNPLPEQNINYRVLRNASEDSIGIVYAASGHLQQVLNRWEEVNRTWQSIFGMFCFVVLLFLVIFWINLKSAWKNLLFQLVIIGIGWAFFNYISISERWLPNLLSEIPAELLLSYQRLCEFTINGFFLFAGAYAIYRTLRTASPHFGKTGFFPTLIAGLVAGSVNMALLVFTFRQIYKLVLATNFSLLNLEILPPAGTFFLYSALGLALWGVTLLILTINQFLLQLCRHYYKVAVATAIAGFTGGFILLQFYSGQVNLNWQFYLGIGYYGLVIIFSIIYFKYPLLVTRSSTLRNAAAAAFILALAGAVIIYRGHLNNQDEMLVETANIYLPKEDEKARQLTVQLLSILQRQFFDLTTDDLENRGSFIQSQFRQTVSESYNENNSPYKVHLQLIRVDGALIAEYSNYLITPAWLNYYDASRFYTSMLMEGMDRNFIRPVIQQPQLINQQTYNTFYRGWIPLYGEDTARPIAWIAGSIYQERPDFKKPMQALLASLNYGNRKQPVAIQTYKNRQLLNYSYHGASGYFPIYNALTVPQNTSRGDSLLFYNTEGDERSYRHLLVRTANNQTMKVSTITPSIHNRLFSFFRLNFTLLLVGFVVSVFLQFVKTGKIELVNKNNTFQYRILDSFLLATLAFLILIIAGSYFALNRQNRNLVKQQLLEKLELIGNTPQTGPVLQTNQNPGERSILQPLTSQLNTDASFYENKIITRTTTPQIYQQHLLPAALPFQVYHQLFNNQKKSTVQTLHLANQQLFVGYQPILSDENELLTVMAIPTFAQSPKYRGQLLETTSYLVMLYFLVFGIFIVGTIIISGRLTKPLYNIRQGLHKISAGDLDTKIPVKSRDEIGLLALSYNRMVSRLKRLREELAKSEREAAWKEIAQQAAHEIKNPLTPMKLNIQHLQQQVSKSDNNSEEIKEKIKQISENMLIQIDSMNKIATNYLNYSKHEELDFEDVDINELIKRIENLHKHSGKKTLKTDLTNEPAIVSGVEDELSRVIFNLVKNAFEATPEDGDILLRTYTNLHKLYIEVKDHGVGIPEEDKDDIFTPNFSTKTSGTGLGLAICKKIVETHKGSISFHSNSGKGTTFSIILPLKN